jgi:hypothetical protein
LEGNQSDKPDKPNCQNQDEDPDRALVQRKQVINGDQRDGGCECPKQAQHEHATPGWSQGAPVASLGTRALIHGERLVARVPILMLFGTATAGVHVINVALAHGTSDGQKTMGMITLVLITANLQPGGTRPRRG